MTKWPENPEGYIMLGYTHIVDFWVDSTKSTQESLEKAMELVQKALKIDDSVTHTYGLLAQIYCYKREYDRGIAAGVRALALDPGTASAHESYGMLCTSPAGGRKPFLFSKSNPAQPH